MTDRARHRSAAVGEVDPPWDGVGSFVGPIVRDAIGRAVARRRGRRDEHR